MAVISSTPILGSTPTKITGSTTAPTTIPKVSTTDLKVKLDSDKWGIDAGFEIPEDRLKDDTKGLTKEKIMSIIIFSLLSVAVLTTIIILIKKLTKKNKGRR